MHPRGPDSADADILLESKFRSERIYEHPFFATVAFRQYMAIVTPVKRKDNARGNADHLAEGAEDTCQLGTPIAALGNDEFLYSAQDEVIGR